MRYAKVLGTSLTAIGLASAISACATPGGNKYAFGGKPVASSNNLALATRAQIAIASNDLASAVSLAEQAVERTPQDAGFRALLGNAYLASGRYGSAEAAFNDSLSLYGNQPQVALKLALVQIAQGHKTSAIALLQESGGVIDAADRGLALALAGEPAMAVELLEGAAQQPDADARLRQNLALAHALAGDWQNARIVASQDLPADQLDQRMAEWMAFAAPDKAGTRVASFIGIARSPADPGQPTRLALNGKSDVRLASAAPVAAAPVAAPAASPAPTYVPASAPVYAAAPAAYVPAPVAAPLPVEAPVAAPVELAVIEPLAPPPPPPRVIERKAPSTVTVALPAPRPVQLANASPAPAKKAARPALSRDAAPVAATMLRKAAFGNSNSVVQLGAYSSRERVEIAWNKAIGRYSSLKGLVPVTARFDGAKGSVYRLSVKGFASDREAARFCGSLKSAGRECFVRRASGDAPVSFASR